MHRCTRFRAPILAVALAATAVVAAELAAEKQAGVRPPIVKCTRAATNDGIVIADIEVTNPNEAPLPYFGYTSDSFDGGIKEGTISPIYQIELKTANEWKKHPLGFCGTGIGPVTLPAKSKVTFQAVLPAGSWNAVKVGIRWWHPAADKSKSAVAWSGEIDRQAEK
jgi:hypothetical protein